VTLTDRPREQPTVETSLVETRPAETRLAGYTGYLARLVMQQSVARTQAALPSGRSPRDLAILGVLAEGPASQARLGALLEVNRTVMITVIDDLEGAGLVRRERDPADRRRYALRITPEGLSSLERMRKSAAGAQDVFAAAVGPAGFRRLAELLRLIVPDLVRTLPQAVTAEFFFLVDHAATRLRKQREQAMRGIGLEPRCVGMLVSLDSAQPCTQERLAECMGVTGPTIVQVVDELHAAGLIYRDRNPSDRRAHVLRLTSSGEDYLDVALQAEEGAQAELAASLGTDEVTELNALLTAILAG
jgi:DNA-binding MarR family transcriptional regulator